MPDAVAATTRQRVAWWLSLIVLLVTGVTGLVNGIPERGEAEDVLQLSIAYGVVAYGVLGMLAAYGLWRRKSWAVLAGVLWAVVVTYVASMAAVAYAPDDATIIGSVSAGVGAALIGWGVVHTIRATLRRSGRSF